MTAFIVAAMLLTVAVVSLISYPLLGGTDGAETVDSNELNAALLREEFAALDRDRRAGLLDEADYTQARDDLSRRLLDEAQSTPRKALAPARTLRSFAAIVLLLPLTAGLLYAVRGTPLALLPGAAGSSDVAGDSQAAPDPQKMIASLAAKLAANPDNPAGWAMLGRSYTVTGRYDEAVQAFARIGPSLDQNAGWLSEYADAAAMRAGGNPAGEPERLAQRALRVDPDNLLALMLASYGAAARGDFDAALALIERGLRVAPADSDDRRFLQDLLDKSRARASGQAPGAVREVLAGADATSLQIEVDVAPALRQAAQGKVLFVIAKAPGQRMPLAVVRRVPDSWPVQVTLDRAATLDPGHPLSSVPQVQVEARLSSGGTATPAADDLLGDMALPTGRAMAASLTIGHRRP